MVLVLSQEIHPGNHGSDDHRVINCAAAYYIIHTCRVRCSNGKKPSGASMDLPCVVTDGDETAAFRTMLNLLQKLCLVIDVCGVPDIEDKFAHK